MFTLSLLYVNQLCQYYYCSHFTDEDTEAHEYTLAIKATSPDVRAGVLFRFVLFFKCLMPSLQMWQCHSHLNGYGLSSVDHAVGDFVVNLS